MTGWGSGFCAGGTGAGFGGRMGFGQGQFGGRRRGAGRGFGRGFSQSGYPRGAMGTPPPFSAENQEQILKNQANALEAQLQQVQSKLAAMAQAKGD